MTSSTGGIGTGGDYTGEGYTDMALGEPTVDLDSFQALLDRLTTSKKRQQRQKSVEGRRDIYAGGLASMMSNF
jgi:hypothetical protein